MRLPPPSCRRPALGAWLTPVLVLVVAAAAAAQGGAASAPVRNRVLELDGDGAYVELPVTAFEGLTAATLEAWVRCDDWGFFSEWFAYGEPNGWRGLGLNHFGTSSVLQFFIYPGRAEDLHVVSVTAPSEVGMWLHLAATSGPEGMCLYFNGLLVGQHPYDGSFAALGEAAHAYLGRSSWDENAPFRGALDEVRLWSVARSAEQIAAAMNRPLTGAEPGLVALWNFDRGDAGDATTKGHGGRLRAGAHTEAAPFPGRLASLRPTVVHAAIRDAGGALVPGARLHLRDARGQVFAYNTGDRGGLSMAVPDTGWFDVEVLSSITSIPQRRIHLVAGQLLQLDLRPPPPSLVAHWAAEGDARDDIGAHDGTLVGQVGFGPGVVGQAFEFGGSGRDAKGTDVVRVPWASALNPEGSFTVTAWVYPTQDTEMRIIGMWGDAGDWDFERAYLLLIRPGRRLSFLVSDDAHQRDAAFHWFDSRPYVLSLHTWTMVTGVWDADRSERRIYVNGALVGRRTDPGFIVTRSIADLGIGAIISTPEGEPLWRPFDGRIDEVGLFAVALPEDEIQRLYSMHARARWPADGDAIDATGSGHDGALVNVTFAPGIRGQAFAFDGDNSYVEIDPRIGNYGLGDFTVDLWLWLDAATSVPRPLVVKRAGGDVALGLVLGADGRVDGTLAGPLDSLRVQGRTVLSLQDWHHVALVRRGAQATLFVDGEPDGTDASTGIVELGTRHVLWLGGGPADTSLAGRLDEVALHNRALGGQEIRALYRATLAARSRRLWRSRLRTGGMVVAGLLAVLAGARALSQRRARRRQQERLAEAESARRAAEEANAAKSAYLANMSHEIRTPMNAIMGHAQMLRDEQVLDEAQRRRSVAAICDQGDILLGLIGDILDLSKSEAGRMELQEVDFELRQLIDGLQVLFELRCRQKGLRLRIESQGDMGVVHGDESKLRQVLVNLLGNAVKFTDEGEASLHVSSADGEYRFEVRDTGPGIAPAQQEAMFQPFQQGSSGLTRGGTGLGLAIAQRHVALMGGRLGVVSAPGEGSCFAFRVALREAAGAPSTAASPEAAATATGLVLPADLRIRMRQAAQMQNVTEMKRCLTQLQRLGEREARFAQAMEGAVQRFDLRPLIRALEGMEDD